MAACADVESLQCDVRSQQCDVESVNDEYYHD
jgi:hypothetical protein